VSCAEPVSWLRLERRHLGEVTGEESARIERHLAGCAECAAAASSLQSWNGRMPALPAVAPPRRRWTLGLFAVPAAAALALVLWPRPPSGIKGSDVALTLVRERGGDIALDPGTFAPTDRFKLLVTCPAAHALTWDVVVFQSGQVSYPFRDRPPIPCANRTPLPGALLIDGSGAATICLLWGQPDRARLTREGQAALPPQARCERLLPQPP
jgi:hypothetical protein